MCLIAIAHNASPKFPLVVAANRDELYARPTRPAHVWEDDARIVGGLDLRAGGTWLALRRGGRFGAITNVRGAGREGGASRGTLVAGFVRGETAPMDFAKSIRGSDYAGFHLILGDGDCVHVTNSGEIGPVDGIFAISNAAAGEHWEKVDIAGDFLRAAIDRNEETDDLAYELLEFLSTSRGGPIEREVFVTSPEYGTRSSTVILCDVFGDYLFVEQNFGPNGERQGDKVKLTLT